MNHAKSADLDWKRGEPFSIGCRASQMPIVIGGAVCPPYLATLAKRSFEPVYPCSRRCFRILIAVPLGNSNQAPDSHELRDQMLTLRCSQSRVRRPPKSPPHDKIPTIWGNRIRAVGFRHVAITI